MNITIARNSPFATENPEIYVHLLANTMHFFFFLGGGEGERVEFGLNIFFKKEV